MSDTPESDAAWAAAWDEGGCHEGELLDKMQKLERQRNELLREMERYLPVLQHLENSPAAWEHYTKGLGIATLNGYKSAIANAKGADCPNCDNIGWFMVPDSSGEPTPEQCQWCHTTPNSKFNLS